MIKDKTWQWLCEISPPFFLTIEFNDSNSEINLNSYVDTYL